MNLLKELQEEKSSGLTGRITKHGLKLHTKDNYPQMINYFSDFDKRQK